MSKYLTRYLKNLRVIRSSSSLRLEFWSGLQAMGISIGVLHTYPQTPNTPYVQVFAGFMVLFGIYQLGALISLSLKHRHISNWLLSSIGFCFVAVFYFDHELGLMMGLIMNSLMTLDCFLTTYHTKRLAKDNL